MHGRVTRFIWAPSRKPMAPSVQPLPEHRKPLHSGLSPTSVSPFTQTPKQRSEGWASASPALARDTRLRQGSTSQPSTGEGRGLSMFSADQDSYIIGRRRIGAWSAGDQGPCGQTAALHTYTRNLGLPCSLQARMPYVPVRKLRTQDWALGALDQGSLHSFCVRILARKGER